jgi:elongation factor Ts
MAITSEQVKLLRDKTGAGMMDCKKALTESAGDLEKAIEYLRKKGAATTQKRADKAAKEGIIVTNVSSDAKTAIIVEVNCETDFVARGNDFVNFANLTGNVVMNHKPSTVEQLMDLTASDNKKVSAHLNDMMAKIGEKLDVRRFSILSTDDGLISAYTHLGNKIGVLVELNSASDKAKQIGRDIAMQVAAMNPQFISRDQVSIEVIQRELEIYRTQAKNEGKPDIVVEKIANGKLEKFYQEVCLSEQIFIKDSGKTVKDVLNDAGENLILKRFVRFHLGEEQK